MATVIEHKSGPNLLVRAIWRLFIGWWASGIVVGVAWVALIMFNRTKAEPATTFRTS